MAPRANWKGMLKISELTCPVALYTASSTSDRISFHMINRKTGDRLRREFVDAESGQEVAREDQVKGYEIASGEHVILTPDEIADAIPESDKTLAVSGFLDCGQIDKLYFDKPYYLAPADPTGREAYVLIRDGMRKKNVAALARTVLFRRLRVLLIRADDGGLIAHTLNFDHEVRSPEEAFDDIPERKIKGEMLDLAKHIITTKTGSFDPAAFDDRYEAALAALVKAKAAGKTIPAKPRRAKAQVVDLMAALLESADLAGKRPSRKKTG
ncbi:Ku protein [Paracoccus aestuariivivens]|uniref:Non-homologous end joining protein Ku n=2 Tax=Paracoccus aestuariivivens TaxID=1820333 RepID=A0A6L6JII8_9RHOB|nr:Ku protein [Paracoccus aestuariivivens]MTH79944.1 Ku protein [Paracoccus aestuariivivens]